MPCVALANVEYLTIYDFLVQGSSRRKKGLGDGGIWKGGAAELHACTGLTEGSQARLAMCVIPKLGGNRKNARGDGRQIVLICV
ncbi:hypothetical protein BRADI_2g59615v3 [Brachypodium distachyon]|uniref:Uncharacterized protein n=1 Tax=Brachypodium distachyon TaxID=15368 RepID=A0A2K2DGW2_BRADI|nr:hypothetical protein BRADI_2g59615v3 [Brachypodium distachyon]